MKPPVSHVLSAIFKHLKSRPDIDSTGIEAYRTLLDNSTRAFKPDPGVDFSSFFLDHIPAAWLTPENAAPHRSLLYIHGGGFVAGSIRSHRDLASRIAAASATRTLMIEYRLAPEHPFPAGQEDVIHAFFSMQRQNASDTIHIAGDSAGGGLCLGLLAHLDRIGHPMPASAVFISPWVDLECRNASHDEKQPDDPMLNRALLLKIAKMYTKKPLSDPGVSPINHRFCTLCPVLIHAGENEVLLDDAKALERLVKKTGAQVMLSVEKDMFHVWHYFARYLKEARTAIDEIGRFIKSHST